MGTVLNTYKARLTRCALASDRRRLPCVLSFASCPDQRRHIVSVSLEKVKTNQDARGRGRFAARDSGLLGGPW